MGGAVVYRWLAEDAAQPITSVAVLPFANEGGDPDMEYLSDGLTESLIDRLSQFPNMKVMSRSAIASGSLGSLALASANHSSNRAKGSLVILAPA